jgi:hypothetical protein
VARVQRLAQLGFAPRHLWDPHRGPLRLHVGHAARHARHHARHSPPSDQLLAAQEKVLRWLEYAIGWSRATGINVAFIPLHRGSDGSCRWRSSRSSAAWLKALQVGLVEAGIMPFVFYEACGTSS